MASMETPPPAASGVAVNPTQAPAPGPAPVGAGNAPGQSTPEQRAKWREKNRRAYQRRKAREAGLPDPEPDPSVVGKPADDPAQAGGGGVAPVPWDSTLLDPLFRTIVPEAERLDIATLRAKASSLGPDMVRMVEADGKWNPVAKSTIITTGPQVAAQVLTSMGVSVSHAPAIALVMALGSIMSGHMLLASKLDEMAKAKATAPAEPTSP